MKAPCTACSRMVPPNDADQEVTSLPSYGGSILCRRHWLDYSAAARRKIACRVAAAMAIGFAGKSHEEIAAASWALAEALVRAEPTE